MQNTYCKGIAFKLLAVIDIKIVKTIICFIALKTLDNCWYSINFYYY